VFWWISGKSYFLTFEKAPNYLPFEMFQKSKTEQPKNEPGKSKDVALNLFI